jgi:hypothetical protein
LAAKIRVPKTSNVERLELWARLKPSKTKSRFGCSGTSQWTRENPVFLPVVHRDAIFQKKKYLKNQEKAQDF